MEKVNSQVMIDNNSNEVMNGKKHNKKWLIIISSLVAIFLAIAGVLFVYLYKIPHDDAINNFNSAVEQFKIAETELSKRNQELDDSIKSLSGVVYADNIPVDEFLLMEATSILEEARSIPRDSAPLMPERPKKTDEINEAVNRILALTTEVQAMGEYGDIINRLSATEVKYQTMIEQFQNCITEVVWMGVDEQNTVLRFVAKISNSNPYALRNVTTEWVAYDKNDAIVGAYDGVQPDIPANDYIYYVGGAGGANLSGTPVRVELRTTTEGLLTNRELPKISVNNVRIEDNGFNWFTVSADCITDSEVNTVDLDGQIIIKDADSKILDADFWSADNLPSSIAANGKFVLSSDFFDLPAVPKNAEVYMYYVWQ